MSGRLLSLLTALYVLISISTIALTFSGGEEWLRIGLLTLLTGLGFLLLMLRQQHHRTETLKSQMSSADRRNQALIFDAEENMRQQIRQNEQLRQALLQAESANKAKTDFLANMSHELRTPMSGVLGMCELLRDTPMNSEQKELVQTIYQSSEQLLAQLNDILDISKVESGDVAIEIVPFNLRQSLRDLLRLYEVEATPRGLKLELLMPEDTPELLLGDYIKLQQIFRNLISNAVKFTEEGAVIVQVTHDTTGISDNGIPLRIMVSDSGIGIPQHKLVDIFDKFTQADASTTRKYGGTGLGLAITKQLVELMGGSIAVESEPGVGTTFTVSLRLHSAQNDLTLMPVNMPQPRLPNAQSSGQQQQVPLLVVDDHPVNRLFAGKMLAKMGYTQVDIAENGREAIEKIATKTYALVLMDCQMPEMDGYQTTRHIRTQEEGTGRHLPIIAVTANAMVGDKQKCLNAGMDDYLSKPMKRDDLEQMLGRWLTPEITTGTASPAIPEAASCPIDLQHLASFTDGDPQEEQEIFTLFSDQAKQCMREMEACLSDDEGWKKAAHRLKGSSANLGATQLAALCKKAELEYHQPAESKQMMLMEIGYQLEIIEQFIQQRAIPTQH